MGGGWGVGEEGAVRLLLFLGVYHTACMCRITDLQIPSPLLLLTGFGAASHRRSIGFGRLWVVHP